MRGHLGYRNMRCIKRPLYQETVFGISLDTTDGNDCLVHKLPSGEGRGQRSSRHGDLFYHLKQFLDSYVADKKIKSAVSI